MYVSRRIAQSLDASPQSLAFGVVDPGPVDTRLDGEGGLAVVVDLGDVDGHGYVVGVLGHGLGRDPGGASGGEGDVALGQDEDRHLRVVAEPGEGVAAAMEPQQDGVVAGAHRRGDGDGVGAVGVDGGEHRDGPGRPFGQGWRHRPHLRPTRAVTRTRRGISA